MGPAWRSLLFVPADDMTRVEKAARTAADAIILDLEDGVPNPAKPMARQAVAAAAAALRCAGKEVIVRINSSWRDAVLDLDAAACPDISTVMVPKAETAGRLSVLGEMLAEFEVERRLVPIALLPLIESARGLASAVAIAATPRVSAIALGSEDFSLDIGVPPSSDLLDLPCRQLALAAAAGGVGAYAMPLSIAAFRDEPAIAAAAAAASRYGCQGALCIHPIQVEIVNRAFMPSVAELEEAAAILRAWDAAVAEGRAVTNMGGRMVDAPVAARAARMLRASPKPADI